MTKDGLSLNHRSGLFPFHCLASLPIGNMQLSMRSSMFTGGIGFSQKRIGAKDAAAIAAKQDQKLGEAAEQKRKILERLHPSILNQSDKPNTTYHRNRNDILANALTPNMERWR
jgi:hypothetical protein